MKRTIGQTVIAIEQSVGTLYSKEDILTLLKNIEEDNAELSDEKKEDIVSDIMQNLEYAEDTILDKDSISLNIDSSNYISVERVDINFDVIRNAVRDVVINL